MQRIHAGGAFQEVQKAAFLTFRHVFCMISEPEAADLVPLKASVSIRVPFDGDPSEISAHVSPHIPIPPIKHALPALSVAAQRAHVSHALYNSSCQEPSSFLMVSALIIQSVFSHQASRDFPPNAEDK